MKHIVRLVLTAALLWVVWYHAHWSVALCLTLLAINVEADGWLMNESSALALQLAKKFVSKESNTQ